MNPESNTYKNMTTFYDVIKKTLVNIIQTKLKYQIILECSSRVVQGQKKKSKYFTKFNQPVTRT